MNLVDSILSLALLFLWIDWRTGQGSRRPKAILTLANAVRPVERRRIPSGYGSLLMLIVLLLVRPVFYYSIGLKLRWTPELDFLAFSIPWRSDLLDLMFVYSTISFLLTLGFFYMAILLLGAVNREMPDLDVMRHFVQLQLGWLELIPWFIKPVLPMIFAGLGWLALAPLLARIGLLPSLPPARVLWGQALALGMASLLAWKWILGSLFLVYLLNNYVYLGTHPVWPYLSGTARKLLRPLSFLTMPKVDLAPIAGIVIVFCLADFVIQPAVLRIFQKFSA